MSLVGVEEAPGWCSEFKKLYTEECEDHQWHTGQNITKTAKEMGYGVIATIAMVTSQKPIISTPA